MKFEIYIRFYAYKDNMVQNYQKIHFWPKTALNPNITSEGPSTDYFNFLFFW